MSNFKILKNTLDNNQIKFWQVSAPQYCDYADCEDIDDDYDPCEDCDCDYNNSKVIYKTIKQDCNTNIKTYAPMFEDHSTSVFFVWLSLILFAYITIGKFKIAKRDCAYDDFLVTELKIVGGALLFTTLLWAFTS